MAPAAFAIGVRLASSGQFEAKQGAQMFQTLPLRHLGIINNVVDAAQALSDEMHERGCCVIGVDLIEDAAIAVIAFDGGLAFQEILQNKRAARPIDAGEPCNGPLRTECDVFCLAQQAASVAIRISKAGFINDFTVYLGIDTGAAGVERKGGGERLGEMPHAIDIDGLVHLGTTPTGAGTVDDGVDAACAKPGGKRGDSSVAGNIAGLRAPGLGQGKACG